MDQKIASLLEWKNGELKRRFAAASGKKYSEEGAQIDERAEKRVREVDKVNKIALELVEKQARKGQVILDVGCGTGVFSVLLAKKGMDVYGIDISDWKEAFEKLKGKFGVANAWFSQFDALELNAREVFDGASVIGLGSAKNLDFEKVVSNISASIKKGGWLLLADLAVDKGINAAKKNGFKLEKRVEAYEWAEVVLLKKN
ncbi:Ribosomal protein L11 methyltransferase [Candidatus Gugararchaeum adminiculabundum]|nr:Ribosomal protein L11 methyltransferase [Candidatus Gugararchaeum adminiculabundum]